MAKPELEAEADEEAEEEAVVEHEDDEEEAESEVAVEDEAKSLLEDVFFGPDLVTCEVGDGDTG